MEKQQTIFFPVHETTWQKWSGQGKKRKGIYSVNIEREKSEENTKI